MKRLITAVAVAALLSTAAPAAAHGTGTYGSGKAWWPSIDESRRVQMVKTAHDVFDNHDVAHWFLRLILCESQGRWWLRDYYWGTIQADHSFRTTYGPNPYDGWPFREQAISAKEGRQARGTGPWPNCG